MSLVTCTTEDGTDRALSGVIISHSVDGSGEIAVEPEYDDAIGESIPEPFSGRTYVFIDLLDIAPLIARLQGYVDAERRVDRASEQA